MRLVAKNIPPNTNKTMATVPEIILVKTKIAKIIATDTLMALSVVPMFVFIFFLLFVMQF